MGWNVIEVTEKNGDKVRELMHRLYQKRQKELASFLPEHENEVEKLPQILKVRMNALKEVNPEKFSDSPELVLSTLAVAELIKRFPDGADQLQEEDVKKAHEKYHIVRGEDVNPCLVSEIFFSYFNDVKSGAITKDGKIVDIEKSEVMKVFHNRKENGVPIDAKETVLKFKPTKNVPTRDNGIEM
jgi:hypothetical protein